MLAEVRRRLANEERCLLVSTQCIEAGVDVDFPTVHRAFIRELHSVLDEAVDTRAGGVASPGPYDISRVDFDRLRKEFERSPAKRTTVQNLRQAIEERVQRLIIQNPLRTDFQKHYETIVAEYNSEKARPTIEKTFEQLLKFIQDLDEEATRAIREGLDEESLAIFDLLKKPELTANDIERIKEVAVELLKSLKEEKLKIDHWREKESTRDAVRLTIRDFLWSDTTGLPLASYTETDVHLKADEVFRHVFRVYPTLPSPYFGLPAQMPPSRRVPWTVYDHPGL